MKILQIGDPILEQKTKKVKDFKEPGVQKLIDELEQSVGSDVESAGLAAPQIGVSLSVCTVKVIVPDTDSKDQKIITLINPQILKSSTEKTVYWEGCLSVGVGDDRLFGPVERSSSVSVEYFDRNGETQNIEAIGYFSHIVQHEIDHLEGVLFIKHVVNPANIWKNKDLDEYIDKHGSFPFVIGEKNSIPDLVVD